MPQPGRLDRLGRDEEMPQPGSAGSSRPSQCGHARYRLRSHDFGAGRSALGKITTLAARARRRLSLSQWTC